MACCERSYAVKRPNWRSRTPNVSAKPPTERAGTPSAAGKFRPPTATASPRLGPRFRRRSTMNCPSEYRRRLFGRLQCKLPSDHSLADIRSDDLRALTKAAFEIFERQMLDAAKQEGERPSASNLPADGSLISRTRVDPDTGEKHIDWYGARSFIADMSRGGRRVLRFLNPRDGSVLMGPPFESGMTWTPDIIGRPEMCNAKSCSSPCQRLRREARKRPVVRARQPILPTSARRGGRRPVHRARAARARPRWS